MGLTRAHIQYVGRDIQHNEPGCGVCVCGGGGSFCGVTWHTRGEEKELNLMALQLVSLQPKLT